MTAEEIVKDKVDRGAFPPYFTTPYNLKLITDICESYAAAQVTKANLKIAGLEAENCELRKEMKDVVRLAVTKAVAEQRAKDAEIEALRNVAEITARTEHGTITKLKAFVIAYKSLCAELLGVGFHQKWDYDNEIWRRLERLVENSQPLAGGAMDELELTREEVEIINNARIDREAIWTNRGIGDHWRHMIRKLMAGKLRAEFFAGSGLAKALPDETDEQYTDRLTGADKTGRYPYPEQRNRQCSIGYHNECSDPQGEQCKCPCHYTPTQWLEEADRKLAEGK